MAYFYLISIATDSLFYGILLAAITMTILYFTLQMISKSCVRTVPFYIAGIILALLLTIQDTLIVATFQAKGMVDAVEVYVQQLIGIYDQSPKNLHETQAILNKIVQDFPLVGWFANITNIQVNNAQELAEVMAESLRRTLNIYLWKRFGWCTTFIFLAILTTFLADKKNKHLLQESNRNSRRSATNRDNRHSASAVRSDRHTGRASRRHRF